MTSLLDQLASDLDQHFPELIDAYGSMVLTLACRLTDPTTGQDITQEAFLRAYRALDGYTAPRIIALELRPWLATITRNLVRNEYRRRDRRATVPLTDDARQELALRDGSDTAFSSVDTYDELNSLLAQLTEAQREAVVLHHLVGLPIREVAATMVCPEGTAKSHVSRGLQRLRQERTNSIGADQ